MTPIKSTSIIHKTKPKPRSPHITIIEHTITYSIARNRAHVIITPSPLTAHIIKETPFRTINPNVIEKTLSSYGRLYNLQNIKERYSLIREIIDEIAVLENRFNYQAPTATPAPPVHVRIHRRHGYHYAGGSSSNFEENDNFRVSFIY